MLAMHPGEALRVEMKVRHLSAHDLALALHVSLGRVTDILAGKRAVTPDTALRLGRCLGTGAPLWLNMQTAYDLTTAENKLGDRINNEVRPVADVDKDPHPVVDRMGVSTTYFGR